MKTLERKDRPKIKKEGRNMPCRTLCYGNGNDHTIGRWSVFGPFFMSAVRNYVRSVV